MATARYWRIVGIETYTGGDLELSELQLHGAGGRVDTTATLTSSHAPIAGALADLVDGNTATVARFSAGHVRSAGFFIAWDLGSSITAIGLRVGSAVEQSRFVSALTLQYFDGAAWQGLASFGRFAWPGASALGEVPSVGGINIPEATLFLDGSVDFADTSPVARTMTPHGGVSISSAQALYGDKSMLFNGSNGYLASPASASLGFAPGDDFTISFNALKSANGSADYDGVVSTTTNGNATDGWFVELSSTRGFIFAAAGQVIFSINLNPNTSQWKHWEVSRKAGVLRAFGGGVKLFEAQDTRNYQQAGLSIGRTYPGGYPFAGFLQQVLIVKGLALHDSDFVPASLVGGAGQAFLPKPVKTAYARSLVGASAAISPYSTERLAAAVARDVEFGGSGTVYGTTKTKGTPNLPTKARVVLLHQRSKLPVRETWSDPVTGAFVFSGIDTSQQFLTLAEDADGNFRPVAANRLTPEVLV